MRTLNRRVLTKWLLFALCATSPAFGADSPDTIGQRLQAVLDQVVAGGTVDPLGTLAGVSAPKLHLEWTGAAGRNARDEPGTLKPNQPFRIASVTKVFVAAAIFQLIGEDRLGLYDPIIEHISTETARTLISGGYDPKTITVAQLLGHTSGLFDFDCPDYEAAVLAPQNKHKRWTRLEQIQFAMQHGKPVGRPGERYAYSDTGYVILGEIIERTSGESMPAYVRHTLKFDELHLNSTYWELLEPAPPGLPPRAHQYYGDVDIFDHTPSFDLYGGGGIVSTTADLNHFMRALLSGRLFQAPSSLATSLLPVETEQPMRHPSALMLFAVPFGTHTCWAHDGYWGTTSLYCPDIDVAVTTTIDQSIDDDKHGAGANRRTLLKGIAAVLDEELGPVQSAKP